jgi:DMSO/TMAO reductase YedYZ molybdopterin-dependent catalytic subunit
MYKIFLVLLITLSINAKEDLNSTQYETNEVFIDGLVLNKLTLNVEDLEKLSGVKTGSMPVICMSGETKESVQSYEGVKLKTILDKANIKISNKSDFNKIYIQVVASDAYEVIFSYNELFNTKNGDNVIVFYKKNGKLLEPSEGKIGLISSDDLRTGPRHIRWLEKIIVKKID